jgi:Nidogen-like/PEP-CTERM motif
MIYSTLKKTGLYVALALTSLVFMSRAASAQAIRAGYDSLTLAANDDGSTGAIPMGFSINYFGTNYSDAFVNNNGNITFGSALSTFTAGGLTTALGKKIIAPFWADVDTRGAGSGLTKYGTGLYTVTPIGGGVPFDLPAFGVTWKDVGYFSSQTNKLNSFQLILINRTDLGADNWDIEFNYDKILWETGAASGGSNGLGGSSAAAGFSAGTGAPSSYDEFTGSLVNGAFLDSNLTTGLIHGSRNSPVLGRYTFQVVGGVPISAGTVTTPEPGTLGLLALGIIAGTVARRRKGVKV